MAETPEKPDTPSEVETAVETDDATAAAEDTDVEVSAPEAAVVAEPAHEVPAPAASGPARRTSPRTLTGTVVSDRMDKTIAVMVERSVRHPVYGKIVRRKSKIHAHDEGNQCKVGDFVTIVESRPISKQKSWRLESIGNRNTEAAT